jgi:streptogramin lyase
MKSRIGRLGFALMLVSGCGSGPVGGGGQGQAGTSGAFCVPGASVACACTDGRQGAQVCKANGSGLDLCVCAAAGGSGGSGGGALGGAGGRGGVGGGAAGSSGPGAAGAGASGRGGMSGASGGGGMSGAGGGGLCGSGVGGSVQAGTGGSEEMKSFVEFPTPTASSSQGDIATGPDGNLWFVEQIGNNIGRITPSGAITEFPLPTAGASAYAIARGPDGNLWFTEWGANKIGRITPAGVVTEFAIPDGNAKPAGIAAGPDGRLWFTQEGISGFIGAMTTAGVFTKYPFPTYQVSTASAYGITAGSDGALWFTAAVTVPAIGGGPRIGRMSTSGAYTEFTLPCALAATAPGPDSRIVLAPDGKFWFTLSNWLGSNYIAVTSTTGAMTGWEIPSHSGQYGANLFAITAGPDGNIWFTERGFGTVVRMTPSGTMTEVIARDRTNYPVGITAGPDGNIWFTRSQGSIARMAP